MLNTIIKILAIILIAQFIIVYIPEVENVYHYYTTEIEDWDQEFYMLPEDQIKENY